MGSWISRKKKSTAEQLESIATELSEMELYRRDTEFSRKRLVGYFILLSVGFYGLAVVLGYFYYFPHTWSEALLRLLVFLLLPMLLFWTVRLLINWLFALKQERNDQRGAHLRLRRQQLLEEVKAKEPYKTAKEILEKFDPAMQREARMAEERKRQQQMARPTPQLPQKSVSATSNNNVFDTPNSNLRQRQFPPQTSLRAVSEHNLSSTSLKTPSVRDVPMPLGTFSIRQPNSSGFPPATPIQLNAPTRPPGPILPRDRSVVDKMVDYLLGDGPNNRYALICSQCHSHNGMSLREEFEFVAFRCCYCYAFNPSRKQLPTNPGLSSSTTNLPHPNPPSSGLSSRPRRDSDSSSVGNISNRSGRESPIVDEAVGEATEGREVTTAGGTEQDETVRMLTGPGGTSYRCDKKGNIFASPSSTFVN